MNRVTKFNMTQDELQEIKEKKKCYDGPITGNAKCIVISLLLAGFYWYTPPKNKWVLLTILYVTYILIAYYDHYYECQKGEFGPTFLRSYYEWAKPKTSKQNIIYKNMCSNKEKLILYVDVAMFLLMLFIFPLFLKWKP
jgi:hypothetical protein